MIGVHSLLIDITLSNAKLDELGKLGRDLTDLEDGEWSLAEAKADAARGALKLLVKEQYNLDDAGLSAFSEAIS